MEMNKRKIRRARRENKKIKNMERGYSEREKKTISAEESL
jgi:hypothetical protein